MDIICSDTEKIFFPCRKLWVGLILANEKLVTTFRLKGNIFESMFAIVDGRERWCTECLLHILANYIYDFFFHLVKQLVRHWCQGLYLVKGRHKYLLINNLHSLFLSHCPFLILMGHAACTFSCCFVYFSAWISGNLVIWSHSVLGL